MTHSIRKWNVSQPNIRKEYTKEAEEEKEEEGRIQEQSRYLISMNSNCWDQLLANKVALCFNLIAGSITGQKRTRVHRQMIEITIVYPFELGKCLMDCNHAKSADTQKNTHKGRSVWELLIDAVLSRLADSIHIPHLICLPDKSTDWNQ